MQISAISPIMMELCLRQHI